MFDLITIIKALTDENRLRILMALRKREMCVCQVTAFLDLAPSTTSKHLSILRQARLIESSKKGKWVYYHMPNLEKASTLVRDALVLVVDSLDSDALVLNDERHIAEMLSREEMLCYGMESCEKDSLHSLEIHSLEYQNSDMEAAVAGNDAQNYNTR